MTSEEKDKRLNMAYCVLGQLMVQYDIREVELQGRIDPEDELEPVKNAVSFPFAELGSLQKGAIGQHEVVHGAKRAGVARI